MSEERKQALYQLIRELYREKQAGEIVESFEKVFADDSEDVEAVLDHWLDFYRLQKYRRSKVRRRPTYRERVTACSACGYPASHRHHLWDVAMHGENRVTIQLCANCHELHHLMYNALARDSLYSQKLVRHVLDSGKLAPEAATRIYGWLRAILAYEIENGWLESFKLSDLWIEEKLGWNEYLGRSQASKT